jgi:hypothetical protein
MLEINALLATCDLEQRFTATKEYLHICQQELTSSNCCRPWTLPNYVAFLSNKTSCFDIEVNMLVHCLNNIQFLIFFPGIRRTKCEIVIIRMFSVLS